MKINTTIKTISLAAMMAFFGFFNNAKAQSRELERSMVKYLDVVRTIDEKKIDLKKHPEIKELGNGILKSLQNDILEFFEKRKFEEAGFYIAAIRKLGETFGDDYLIKEADDLKKSIEKYEAIKFNWKKALSDADTLKNKYKYDDLSENKFRDVNIVVIGKYFIYIKRNGSEMYAPNPDTLKMKDDAFSYKPNAKTSLDIMECKISQKEMNEDVYLAVEIYAKDLNAEMKEMLLKKILKHSEIN